MNDSIVEAINNIRKNLIDNNLINDIIENINIKAKSVFDSLKPIMEQIKENSRIMANHSLSLGFYPSNNFSLFEAHFLELEKKQDQINYIAQKIKELLTDEYIEEISLFFKKDKIKSIYEDYKIEDYDTAILKLIVFINVIFNEKLVGVSSEEFPEIKRLCDNIVTGVELPDAKIRSAKKDVDWDSVEKIHDVDGFKKYAYYIFAPYYYTNKNSNTLFKNCNDNRRTHEEIKKEYKKIPYNRNAIIHGYVENYGTELNCLRWFSVLINTYELFKLLEELSVSE